MKVFVVGWVVLLLPLGGIALSYLSETRRGSALGVWVGGWLTLGAALALLAATVLHHHHVTQSTITFWTFSVTQSPFNAATTTLLPANFQVGVGYAATSYGVILASLVAAAVVLGQAQIMAQLRASSQLPSVMRLSALLGLSAELVALAPGLFQLLLGFGLAGLMGAMLAGVGSGRSARRIYLVWTGSGAVLLLAVVFVYVKFAGQVALAATTGKHPSTQTPYGLNLEALYPIWVAAHHGLVRGVGGRTLTISAVLFMVAAAGAAGQAPLQGLWRALAAARSGAGALLQGVAGGVVPLAVLLSVYPLLHLASGAQPALVGLGAVTALLGAVLAVGEHQLRPFAGWVGLSQTGMAVMAVGLGAPAAATAMAVATVLVVAALSATAARLEHDLRVRAVDRLGAVWRQARPAALTFLGALAAGAGVVGVGAFFARAEVLAAALSAGSAPAPLRVLAIVAGVAVPLLLAAACARIAWHLIYGAEPADVREARAVRRQLAQGARQPGAVVPVVATTLAWLAGAFSFLLGRLLPQAGSVPGLGGSGAGLLLVLVAGLAGLGLVWLAGERVRLTTVPGLGGGSTLEAADRWVLLSVGRAVVSLVERALYPAGDLAAQGLADLAESPPPGPTGWEPRAVGVVVAVLAVAAAAATWWGTV
jgi:formate hydrogenlyase subunit 3/multisubunit Na+/H+ antiporter MnhD subunit